MHISIKDGLTVHETVKIKKSNVKRDQERGQLGVFAKQSARILMCKVTNKVSFSLCVCLESIDQIGKVQIDERECDSKVKQLIGFARWLGRAG